ncbi:MAG: hypothetical protein K9K40_00500 [Desulfotignum sp.]|nr:hypothetical protein [Desulfotignum sp.]
MEQVSCPACGDNNLEKNTIKKSLHEPYGGSKNIDIVCYTCNFCGFSGDIFNENEKDLQAAIDELKANSVKNILENFQKQHYNFSAIERALEIPQRSLSKWKSASKPSASAVALLKYLHLFPWLIEVAEHKFDFNSAQRIHISDAFNQLIGQMTFNEDARGFETTTTMEVLRLKIEKKFDADLQEGDDQDFGFSFINQRNECLATVQE